MSEMTKIQKAMEGARNTSEPLSGVLAGFLMWAVTEYTKVPVNPEMMMVLASYMGSTATRFKERLLK